jgi:4-hydroxy-tetrahydrodipicolinate reductase
MRDSLGKTRADRTHRAHNARMPATDRHAATSQQNSTTDTLRIVIHGANGRMGQRIAACVPADGACHAVRCIDREDEHGLRAGDADAVIDFSSDEGAARAAAIATELGCALLVGTTGLSQASLEAIARAAERVPAMVAPNTSLGVAVTRRLAEEAARLLPGFDVDIVETHHARKLDAPSGTARSLAEAVATGSGKAMNQARIHSIRAGDVIGEHAVTWSGAGERVTVAHSATSRDLFALGALRMARWLARQRPGMHTADQWFADFVR